MTLPDQASAIKLIQQPRTARSIIPRIDCPNHTVEKDLLVVNPVSNLSLPKANAEWKPDREFKKISRIDLTRILHELTQRDGGYSRLAGHNPVRLDCQDSALRQDVFTAKVVS